LYATAPFITAIIQYLHGKEVLTFQKIIGLAVGALGLAPILMQSSGHQQTEAQPELAGYGNLVILVSMVLFCYGWVFFKKLLMSCRYSIQMLNGIAMMIGGLVSVAAVGLVHGPIAMWYLPYSPDFTLLMTAFLLSSLLTYSLYAYLLQVFSPTFISFAGFLEPAFGMLYGLFLIGYEISWLHIASFLVLFLGLYIFYLEELKKRTPSF
jgi:drug/metabolite transporter (DMT)-like permease